MERSNQKAWICVEKPGPAVFPPIAAITWLKNAATDCKQV